MGAASAAASTAAHAAASAAFHPGFGGFRPGFGGFHPGFGRFHPAFRSGFVGFHHGFAGRRFFFHHGFRRNGIWVNGWWGPAVAVGLVAGSYPFWGGGSNCWSYRPAYDSWGNFVGQVYVNLCQ